jgi:two-component system response regulator FlrC
MASFRNHQTLAEIERNHILETLKLCGNNRTRAAKVLDISIRCLRIKLHNYAEEGFEVPPPSHEPFDVSKNHA